MVTLIETKEIFRKTITTFIKDEIHRKINEEVKYVKFDNAGESIALEEMTKLSSLGMQFENAARNSPYQNTIVERIFATLWGMTRAMLRVCGLHNKQRLRNLLWAECDNMVAQILKITFSDHNDQCSYEKVHNRLPMWCLASNLRTFGEVCVVADRR